MDLETCYKYFVFLNTECDRYLKDGVISEEEMANLKIEFDRFVIQALGSDLPSEIKVKITDLKLDYEYHPQRENINMIKRLVFGRAAKYQREKEHKDAIEALKYDIKGIPMFIQLNY
ncbi:MAG: hypothetical protein Crog4KO_28880 [Crocinitomicaceae bacterium]